MSASTTTGPNFIIAGGSAGNSSGRSNPGSLEQIYENLLSGAAGVVSGLHTKVLDMDAGSIGLAGSAQIGVTETAAEVADNLRILGSIAAYCRANSIVVRVEANLTFPVTHTDGTNALVDQWAAAPAAVGLPITSIEDVQEIGLCQSPTTFANYASIEANAVRTLVQNYVGSSYKMTADNLAVGDMEGGCVASMPNISEWWDNYNAAAKTAGVQSLSFVSADCAWFAPWIDPLSTPANDGFIESLSALAVSYHIALTVIAEGSQTDTSAGQYVMQSEQNAIHLAQLQASGVVDVNNILVRSWDAQPVGIGMISSPNSMVNVAAELAAVYPLYEAGSITAQGSLSLDTPGQILTETGSSQHVPLISIQWDAADIRAGNRLGVVIIDQTGILTATQHGSGTVSNSADNILVLSGNPTDLAAELDSLVLSEPYSGPDTIDVEIFGTAGRLSDNQITILAAGSEQSVGAINSSSDSQGWLSSSGVLNNGTVIHGGSVLTSETLQWSTSGSLVGTISGTTPSGQTEFVKIIGIHEPLAEYGVKNAIFTVNGETVSAVADVNDPAVDSQSFPGGGYANNPGVNQVTFAPIPGWLSYSFNPISEITSLIVRSTTNTFNSISGKLESSVDAIAPNQLTVVDQTGTHPNMFATAFENGGTQVTEYNTGDNPAWQAGWGDQFDSVTNTYDGVGRLVEAFLQGGQRSPLFTIDDVFDPNSGQLWEQFQSTTAPPKETATGNYATTGNPYYPGFNTGPLYETQFLASPNWDYIDWGNTISVDTEVWVDNFIINNFAGFVVNLPQQYTGALNTYPLQFVNGSALDLMYLPGTINVDLNALGSIVLASQTMTTGLSNLNEIDVAGASGSVTITGLRMGGSTMIGGDNVSDITGYGQDTIFTGAGVTTVNTGAGGSTISLTNAAGRVTVVGHNDIVNGIPGGTVSISGSSNTVNGSGLRIFVNAGASVTINGINNTISRVGLNTTIRASHNNTILVTDTAPGSVTLTTIVPNDFNGDSTSDVLVGSSNSGLVVNCQMQNGALLSENLIGGGSKGWVEVGTGDFNGDGTSDILFKNSDSGLVLDWQMSNGTLVAGNPIAGASADWNVIGTGDFNGDGTSDILFENSGSGLVLDWQMSNGTLVAGHPIAGATFDWKFIGTGDFNGDGTSDILFQNSNSGLLLDWQMANGILVAGNPIAGATPDWKEVGTGDFTGNGTDDILFQNSHSGDVLYWEMTNGQLLKGVSVGTAAPGWNVIGTGDYTGNGTTGILLQNSSSGQLMDWEMSNGILSKATSIAGAGSDWQVLR